MQKWEYIVLQAPNQRELNSYGANGWGACCHRPKQQVLFEAPNIK